MRYRTGFQRVWIAAVALGCLGLESTGQTHQTQPQANAPQASVAPELPDSPGALLTAQSDPSSSAFPAESAPDPSDDRPPIDLESTSVMRPAHKYHRVVRPDEQAGPLTAGDKLKLSIISRLTFGEAASTVLAAGWSQWRDSRPHFGTDEDAFGKRIGALALKQTSQSFFAYGAYAAAFHDDPRYYVMGPTVPLVHRAVYSATRTVITQKDDGSRAINWPKLAGIATATALTTAYYPAVDHGFGNESKAFAASLGTSILNDEIHEFVGDALHLIHPSH